MMGESRAKGARSCIAYAAPESKDCFRSPLHAMKTRKRHYSQSCLLPLPSSKLKRRRASWGCDSKETSSSISNLPSPITLASQRTDKLRLLDCLQLEKGCQTWNACKKPACHEQDDGRHSNAEAAKNVADQNQAGTCQAVHGEVPSPRGKTHDKPGMPYQRSSIWHVSFPDHGYTPFGRLSAVKALQLSPLIGIIASQLSAEPMPLRPSKVSATSLAEEAVPGKV